MSQSEVIFRHDEFGGLDWLGLPGQDPDLVIQVITELLTEMKPKNVIERCWVRDIAILTARIDFLRRAHWMIMACMMEDIAFADAEMDKRAGRASADSEDLLMLIRRMTQGESLPEGSRDPRVIRLLGRAMRQNFAFTSDFTRLEIGVCRERDRLLGLYDSRRAMQRAEAAEVLGLTEALAMAGTLPPGSEATADAAPQAAVEATNG